MKVTPTDIPDVLILEPRVFGDERGFFFESFNVRTFRKATDIDPQVVQDNHSGSRQGTLRGIHYQIRQAQAKLVRAIRGAIWDVAVDLRRSSPTFGRSVGVELSADNRRQMWIPEGFGHGFLVLSEFAEVLYKTTDFYAPDHERTIRWDDPDLAIPWPLEGREPTLSKKDRSGVALRDAEVFP